jgi:hypothetical protein
MSLKENAPKAQVDLGLTDSGLRKRSEVTASKSTQIVQTFLCFQGGAVVLPFLPFFAGFAIQILCDGHEAVRASAGDRGSMSVAALVPTETVDPLWHRPG